MQIERVARQLDVDGIGRDDGQRSGALDAMTLNLDLVLGQGNLANLAPS